MKVAPYVRLLRSERGQKFPRLMPEPFEEHTLLGGSDGAHARLIISGADQIHVDGWAEGAGRQPCPAGSETFMAAGPATGIQHWGFNPTRSEWGIFETYQPGKPVNVFTACEAGVWAYYVADAQGPRVVWGKGAGPVIEKTGYADMALSPDGQYIALLGHAYGSLEVFDVATGQLVSVLQAIGASAPRWRQGGLSWTDLSAKGAVSAMFAEAAFSLPRRLNFWAGQHAVCAALWAKGSTQLLITSAREKLLVSMSHRGNWTWGCWLPSLEDADTLVDGDTLYVCGWNGTTQRIDLYAIDLPAMMQAPQDLRVDPDAVVAPPPPPPPTLVRPIVSIRNYQPTTGIAPLRVDVDIVGRGDATHLELSATCSEPGVMSVRRDLSQHRTGEWAVKSTLELPVAGRWNLMAYVKGPGGQDQTTVPRVVTVLQAEPPPPPPPPEPPQERPDWDLVQREAKTLLKPYGADYGAAWGILRARGVPPDYPKPASPEEAWRFLFPNQPMPGPVTPPDPGEPQPIVLTGPWDVPFLATPGEPWGFMDPAFDPERRGRFRRQYRGKVLPVSAWAAYEGLRYDFRRDLPAFAGYLHGLIADGIRPCVVLVTDQFKGDPYWSAGKATDWVVRELLPTLLREGVPLPEIQLGWEQNQIAGWDENERDGAPANPRQGHDILALSRVVRELVPAANIWLHLQQKWWGPHYTEGAEARFWQDAKAITGLLHNDWEAPVAAALDYLLDLTSPHGWGPGIVGRLQALGKKCVAFEMARSPERQAFIMRRVIVDGRCYNRLVQP